jgi:lipopolysaccharide transport system permease protein
VRSLAGPRTRVEHVYDADGRLRATEALAELWQFREVLWAFASRTFRLRYKQTVLGVAWVVLQPLLFLAVFVLVFGRAAGLSGGGAPYAAFAASSLVGWSFVSASVALGANALVVDAGLLRKVYFPREAAVLGCVISFLPDIGIGMGLVLLLLPLTGGSVGLSLVSAPLLVPALLLPVIAVVLPLAALSVHFRDFRYIIPFGIQLWLFASPVAYPVTELPENVRWVYALLNPVVGPLEGMRRVFALGEWPDWELLGLSALTGVVLTVVGYRLFKRLEGQFADVV